MAKLNTEELLRISREARSRRKENQQNEPTQFSTGIEPTKVENPYPTFSEKLSGSMLGTTPKNIASTLPQRKAMQDVEEGQKRAFETKFTTDPEYRANWFQENTGMSEEDFKAASAKVFAERFDNLLPRAENIFKKNIEDNAKQRGGTGVIRTIENLSSSMGVKSKLDELRGLSASFKNNNVWSGMYEGADLLDVMSGGLANFASEKAYHEALKKQANGEELSEEEQFAIDASDLYDDINETFELLGGRSGWNKAGMAVGQSAEFSAGMLPTSGLGFATGLMKNVGLKAGWKAVKDAANNGVRAALTESLKQGGKVIGRSLYNTGLTYAESIPRAVFMPSTYSRYWELRNERLKNGESLEGNWLQDAGRAGIEMTHELASEIWGSTIIHDSFRAMGKALGVDKAMDAIGFGHRKRTIFGWTPTAAQREAMRNLGYSGDWFSEVASEAAGDVATNLAMGVFFDDARWGDMATKEYWTTLLGATAMQGIAFTSANMLTNIPEYHRLNNSQKKRDNALSNIKSEDLRKDVEIALTHDSAEDMGTALSQIDWNAYDKVDVANAMDAVRLEVPLRIATSEREESERIAKFAPLLEATMAQAYQGADAANPAPQPIYVEAKTEDGASVRIVSGDYTNPDAMLNVEDISTGESFPIIASKVSDIKELSLEKKIAESYKLMFSTEENVKRLSKVMESLGRLAYYGKVTSADAEDIIKRAGYAVFSEGQIATLVNGEQVEIASPIMADGHYLVRDNNGNTSIVSLLDIVQPNVEVAEAQIKMASREEQGTTAEATSAMGQSMNASMPQSPMPEGVTAGEVWVTPQGIGRVLEYNPETSKVYVDINLSSDTLNKEEDEELVEVDAAELTRKPSEAEMAEARARSVRRNALRIVDETSDAVGAIQEVEEVAQPVEQAAEVTEQAPQEVPSMENVPTTADGAVDYEAITDANLYAKLLTQDLGSKEEALEVVNTSIEAYEAEIADMQSKKEKSTTKSVAKNKQIKAMQQQLDVLNQVRDILAPQETMAEVEQIAETPQVEETQQEPLGLVQDDFTATLPKGEAELIDSLARSLGLSVEFVDQVNKGNSNAQILGNKVLIAKKNRDKAIKFLVGHEFTHRMQDLSPEAYAEFKAAVKEYMGEELYNTLLQKEIAKYREHNIYRTQEQLEDEIIADFAGSLAFEADVLDTFIAAHADKKSMWQAILDVLRAIREWILKDTAYDTAEARALQNTIGKLENLLQSASEKAAEGATAQNTEARRSLKEQVAEILDEYNTEGVQYSTPRDVADALEGVIAEASEDTTMLENIITDYRNAQDDSRIWGERWDSGGDEAFIEALQMWSSPNTQYSDALYSLKETDPATLEALNNGEKIKVYRGMQVIDGKLYPPMSAKVDGKMREPIELGVWERAEERPDLADAKGYFKLDKGNKTSLKARYNPYIHTSLTPLNDQFSSAQDRPNLVTVEVEIPASELTSGYKADKAKDAVGKVEWKAGVVQSQLSGTRTVILSRWDRPLRIVPDSEVAQRIVEMFGDKKVVMPSNVVTPSLRAELEKLGVPFKETDNQGKDVKFALKAYHGSGVEFDKFDHTYMSTGEGQQIFGWGTYITEAPDIARSYANTVSDNNSIKYHKKGLEYRINKAKDDIEFLNKRIAVYTNDAEYVSRLRGQQEQLLNVIRQSEQDLQRLNNLDQSRSRVLYEVNIPDNNGDNYITYEERVTEPIKAKVYKALDEFNSVFIEDTRDSLGLKADVSDEDVLGLLRSRISLTSGKDMYNDLSAYLGGDKEASLFLADAGIVGISYPAEYTTGGRADNSRNYVIFNENDAQIVGKEKFSLKDLDVLYLDAVTYDGAGNIIPLSERFNPEKADVRYSAKDIPSLVGVHNISLEKLRKVIKMGGLANPSVAVIDADKQTHEDYGEYSLILPKNMVDARQGKNVGTWAGDAWTPTYPQITKRMSKDKNISRFYKDIDAMPDAIRGKVRLDFDSFMDGRNANALAYWYLFDKGVAPELIDVPARYPVEIVDALNEATNGSFSMFGLSAEERARCLDAFVAYKYKGDRATYDADMAARKERLENFAKNHDKGIVRKKAQEDLDAINEYGFDYDEVSRFIRDVEWDVRHKGETDVDATIKASMDYIAENNLGAEYDAWRNSLDERYGIEEYIFDGYTNSGTRRYLPHTVENASKWMKKQGRQGAVASFPSFGTFVAVSIPKMTTLESIRKRKNLLGKSKEEYDAFREKWENVYFELGKKLQPDAKGFDDYGYWRLIEAVGQKNPKEYIKKQYNIELSAEDVNTLNEMLNAIRTEYPARYFETKFERPLQLNDFVAAVVPDDVPMDVWGRLNDANVKIFEYEKGNSNSRAEAMQKATATEDVRFSLQDIANDVREYDATNGTELYDWLNFVESGSIAKNKTQFHIANTGEILNEYGIKGKINVTRKAINAKRHTDDDDHKLGVGGWAFLVATINNPLVITRYNNEPNSYRIYTIAKINGKNICAGVDVNATNGVEITKITTAFGRDITKIYASSKEKEIYRNENAAEQISGSDNSHLYARLLSTTKVVQNFVNPKIEPKYSLKDTFYSNAENAVRLIKQEKATPEQWLKMIEKNGGLKAGEDKWLGLSDWLKSSDKKTLTKQEVLDFIKENQIQIEEVSYGDVADISREEIYESAEFAELREGLTEYDEDDNPYINRERYDELRRESYDFVDGFSLDYWGGELEVDSPAAAATYLGLTKADNAINETRLSYTTQGLGNKREIALTVPTIEPWNTNDQIHFGDAGNGRAIAWIRFGETKVPIEKTIVKRVLLDAPYKDVNGNDVYRIKETRNHFIVNKKLRNGERKFVPYVNDKPIGTTIETAAFDTLEEASMAMQNYYQEHPYKYMENQRVLVIDEIQSKRHQEGREKGYRSSYQKNEFDLFMDKMSAKYGDNWTKDNLTEEEEAELMSYANRPYVFKDKGIPDAPFEKNWAELAMKRMLRYAAENGYDKVAWTTGEQQADRYGMSNYFNSIKRFDIESMPGRRFELIGSTNIGVNVDEEGNIISSSMSELEGKPLSDVVGKEMAVKMMQMENNTSLEDADLKVGGSGMKAFYDQMLPSFVRKYAKKWGATVGEVTMPSLEENNTMHSVDVTPAMRESVMQGQPLFHLKDNVDDSPMTPAEIRAHMFENITRHHEREVNRINRFHDAELRKAERVSKQQRKQNGEYPRNAKYTVRLQFLMPQGKTAYPLEWQAVHDIANGLKVKWNDSKDGKKRGLSTELGLGSSRREKYGAITTGAQMYVEDYVAQLVEENDGYARGIDDNDVRSIVLDALSQYTRPKEALDALEQQFLVIEEDAKLQESIDYIERARAKALQEEDEKYEAQKASYEKNPRKFERDYFSRMEKDLRWLNFKEREIRVMREKIQRIRADYRSGREVRNQYLAEVKADIEKFLNNMYGRNISTSEVRFIMNALKKATSVENVTYILNRIATMDYYGTQRIEQERKARLLKMKLSFFIPAGNQSLEQYLEQEKISRADAAAFVSRFERENIGDDMTVFRAAFKDRYKGVDSKGVTVAKLIDAETAEIMVFISKHAYDEVDLENIEKKSEALYTEAEKLKSDLPFSDSAMEKIDQAREIIISYWTATAEREELKKSKEDLNEVEARITEAWKNGDHDLVSQLRGEKDAILKDRSSRMPSINSHLVEANDAVERLLLNGKRLLSEEREAQRQHEIEVLNDVVNDITNFGEDYNELMAKANDHRKQTSEERKSKVKMAIHEWTDSLNHLLTLLAPYADGGRGLTYTRFMTAINKAVADTCDNVDIVNAQIAEAVDAIFGKQFQYKNLAQIMRRASAISLAEDVTLGYKAVGKERTPHKWHLRMDNALYLLAMWGQAEGRIKLEANGVTEADIANVEDLIIKKDRRYLDFMNWVIRELLPSRREGRYNEVFRKVTGRWMPYVENYFPIHILSNSRHTEEKVSEAAGDKKSISPSAIKARIYNTNMIDLNVGFFEALMDNLTTMETWASMAEIEKDMNTILSNNRTKDLMNARLGENFSDRLKTAMQVTLGTLTSGKLGVAERWALNASRLWGATKIGYRINTALKQLSGAGALFAYTGNPIFIGYVLKNLAPIDAAEMFPILEKRWKEGLLGNAGLMDLSRGGDLHVKDWLDRSSDVYGDVTSTITKLGMYPNKIVDFYVSAVFAKSVYQFELNRYKKMGYSEEQAKEKALMDAEDSYNKTQQSSEMAYLSSGQINPGIVYRGLNVFMNNSIANYRLGLSGFEDVARAFSRFSKAQRYYRKEAEKRLYEKYIAEGKSEEEAMKKAKEESQDYKGTSRMGYFARGILKTVWGWWGSNFLFNYLSILPYMWFGDDDEKKREMTSDLWWSALFSPIALIPWGKILYDSVVVAYNNYNNRSIASSVLPMLEGVEDLIEDIVDIQRAIREDDDLSNAQIYNTFNTLSTMMVGVDMNTFVSIGDGIADIANGDWMEGTLDILNVPNSQVKLLVGDRKADESWEVYMTRILRVRSLLDKNKVEAAEAAKYNPTTQKWESEPNITEAQKRDITKMYKQYENAYQQNVLKKHRPNMEWSDTEKRYEEVVKEIGWSPNKNPSNKEPKVEIPTEVLNTLRYLQGHNAAMNKLKARFVGSDEEYAKYLDTIYQDRKQLIQLYDDNVK